ncbi:MAG: hypothetical protein PUK38_00630, partial [Coriobacteriaceae bacterium]|nr:hypothetical protein [Coriobacteriaceae bacterium]
MGSIQGAGILGTKKGGQPASLLYGIEDSIQNAAESLCELALAVCHEGNGCCNCCCTAEAEAC